MKLTRTLGVIIQIIYNKLVMKVLKDNYYERTFKCNNCESELLVDRDDLCIDNEGDPYFTCPLCGVRNYVDLFGV